MQKTDVTGVDLSLHELEPVGMEEHFRDVTMGFRDVVDFKVWDRRLRVSRAHIGPNEPPSFDSRIRGDSEDFRFERLSLRSVGDVKAITVDVNLPAVISAPETTVLIATEE